MNRTDIINIYAKIIDAKSYLEIGVRIANDNFNNIKVPVKVGVDSGIEGVFEGTCKMTSDEYFLQNTDTFDLIFIDGLHEKEQVLRDIENSLNVLNENGVIICHDMNPKIKEHQLPITDPVRQKYVKDQKELGNKEYGFWTGDCWKSFVHLRSYRSDLEMFVIDTDFGVGVIKRGSQLTINTPAELTYEYLDSNRKICLNLKSVGDFLRQLPFVSDPLHDFLNSDLGYEESLEIYKLFCKSLMYQDPKVISLVVSKLRKGLEKYSKSQSKTYQDHSEEKIYDRKNIIKDDWIVKNLPSDRIVKHNTSGSTTGEPFSFYYDNRHWSYVQKNCEFDLIREEYNLCNKELQILNLIKHQSNPEVDNFYLRVEKYKPSNMFSSFGAENFVTYFVNWDDYMIHPNDWHDKLLDFLDSAPFFDIILSSGPVINILNRYIRKHEFSKSFAYLLSHTTEFPRKEDLQFLKNNGNIMHYCDHMRCWDGGASFFTCKFGTYHLNDNFAWVTQGNDNKLISTDYFNTAAPFINYWNGDRCKIESDYHKCECGRWYRPFKMLENRPFALKGPKKLTLIKEQISQLEFRNKINQVQFDGLAANVYLNEKIDEAGLNKIKEILSDYTLRIYS